MSTHIYTGFKLTTNNWSEIHDHCMQFREGAKTIIRANCLLSFCSYAVDIFDRRCLHLKTDTLSSPYEQASKFLKKQFDFGIRGTRDITCEIMLFPYNDEVYGMTFISDNEVQDAWFSKSFVEEYYYYDNTDKPEELSEEEWETRKKTWDAIFKDTVTPSQRGFTVDCLGWETYVYFSSSEVNGMIGKWLVRNRAMVLAKDSMLEAHTAIANATFGSEAMKAYSEFLAYLKTDAGVAELEKETDRIVELLKPIVTYDDLNEN